MGDPHELSDQLHGHYQRKLVFGPMRVLEVLTTGYIKQCVHRVERGGRVLLCEL